MEYNHILLFLLLHTVISQDPIIANVYYSRITGKYSVIKESAIDPTAAASATYYKTYETEGWDKLQISSYQGSDKKYQDFVKSYAMGYVEGVLTAERIYNFYQNMLHFNTIPDNTKQFILENLDYMKSTSIQKRKIDPYWDQVYNLYKQFQGMADGYNSVVDKSKQISYVEFQLMNSMSDFGDLENWKNNKARPDFSKMSAEDILDYLAFHNRCSSLIKVAPDFSDIWFGHNTWAFYSDLIRIFKEYKFKTNTGVEKSNAVAFSSYPGTISSVDDFFILDNDLYVIETTNNVYNDDLFKLLTPQSIFTSIRAVIANRLSGSGPEWGAIFSRENSGTCNDQFQILDLNYVDLENRKISEGALTIVEQMPGHVEIGDMTDVLKKGYWPSYNTPYFPFIRDLSGVTEAIKKNETLRDGLDYDSCVRANIFRRDQANVNSIEDYKKIIRYNDYENDPLSKGDPSKALASRYDLRKEGKSQCFGNVDAKFVSVKETKGKKERVIYMVNGPSDDTQPPFDWNTTECKQAKGWKPFGQVNTYNFKWVEYKTALFKD